MNISKFSFIILIFCTFYCSILRGSDFFFETDSSSIYRLLNSAKSKTFTAGREAVLESNEAVSLALKSENPIYIFSAYRRLGRVLEDLERLQESSEKYYKALEISYKLPVATQLDIMIDWAIINKKLGNYKISRDYYETALNIALQIKDMEMVDYAFNGLGTLHATVGEFDLALDAYLRSKKLSEERADTANVIKSLNNISEAYLKAKNYDLAIENTRQAYSYALALDDSSKLCRVLNIHGKILTSTKDYNGALKKHLEALNICQNFDNKKQYFLTLILLADAHTQLNQLNKAEFYLEKCLSIKEKVDNYDLPNYYFKLGELYRLQNKNEDARIALQTCIRHAETRKLKDVLQKSYDALAKTYQQQHNFKAAFTYLTLAKRFSDSLYNDENAKRMAEARYKFDMEQSKKEIQTNNEKKLESLKWERNRFMTVVFIICFIIIIFVMGFFLREKNLNNRNLNQKTDQITLQNKRLEKSNEILRQFAYASAHDLKEPLRSISSFVHIIQRKYAKNLPLEAEEYMNFVTNGVKRMDNLLSALLEYSTVASEKHVVSETISIANVIEDVKQNLHAKITEKDAQIKFAVDLPKIWVSRHHLTQLCQNLISNSLKFSKRRPVIVITSSVLENEFILSISDNGIGMRQEYSDKIFRLFQRLSRSVEYEGAGIGLAICKHIVDVYDGRIWFNSLEDEGTTFYIALPMDLIENYEKISKSKKEESFLDILMKA